MKTNTIFGTIKVSDIGKIVTGHTPPRKISDYFGDKTTWIKPTDIEIGSRFVRKTEEKFSGKAYKKYKNLVLPPLSTCVVTIGTVGEKICLTKEESFTNQAINSIIPNKSEYDPLFVYYLLKNNLHLVELRHSGTASGRQNISKSVFSNIKLKSPELKYQKIIGYILAKFDELIENNVSRIALLEKILDLFYDSWFIHFRFPGNGKITHKNSNFDDMPKNWKLDKLESIAKITSGKRPKIFSKEPTSINNIPIYGAGGIMGYTNTMMYDKPIITTGRVGTLGKIFIISKPCWVSDNSLIILPKESFFHEYIALFLQRIDFDGFNRGSSQPLVTQGDLNKRKIILSDEKIIKSFHKIAHVLYSQIDCLSIKNQYLLNTRDLLTSNLLSGNMDISKLGI